MIDRVAAAMREAAARFVLPRFRVPESQHTREKTPGDPVTLADLEAEAFLRDALPRIVDVPVVGEEGWNESARKSLHAGDCWIVDPLDGTRSFVAGDPRFSMIVARIAAGEIVEGWLFFPVTDELFTARLGEGTFRGTERLRVAREAVAGRMRLTWLRDADRARVEPKLRDAGWMPDTPTCWELRRLLVGEPGGYLCSHVTPWDMAAGVLLVREAGGVVKHASGAPIRASDEAGLYVFGPDASTVDGWVATYGLAGLDARSPLRPEVP